MCSLVNVHAQDDVPVANEKTTSAEKIIRFRYDNEDLVDVVNSLAALKEVNVVLPVGPNAIPPETKLTLHMDEKMSLEQAWKFLYTILDVAGYSMVSREVNTFEIKKTNRGITKAALPVYIGIAPEKLPDTDQRIRYLYFMSNVKVSEDPDTELKSLLTGMLPPEISNFRLDPSSNGVIITAKANIIKSVMQVVQLLEKTTFQEKMEFIKLQHTLASVVANLFNNQEEGILKNPQDRYRYGADTKKPNEATYFSKHIKIVADDRVNALIIVGREEAVLRIKKFIRDYIDVPVDSGQSILHVYQLLYLDAVNFAPILQKIVESAPEGTGQSQVEGGVKSGVERYFEGVIVKADAPESSPGEEEKGGIPKGNNNLIIAARSEDWKRIKTLIEDLDVPQPQVILQVLVADLNLGDVRLIGTWLRNPEKWGFPKGFDLQAANLASKNVMVDNYDNPTTLAADLLQNYYDDEGNVSSSPTKSYTGLVPSGSTLVSLSDCDSCKTWAILQLINNLNYRKVLSMPHIIAVHNKKSEIVIGEERFVRDEGVGNQGGTVTATNKWVPANLTITLTPRIAFGEKAEMLTLDISVKINDFESSSASNANRFTREFKTISICRSGGVIALGGLARLADNKGLTETPVLGQIPLLGYFFKSRSSDSPEENLTVFIRPTIIMPKLRGGMGDYTQKYIKLTRQYTKEGLLFDSLKDPVTRWYFKPEVKLEESIDDFIAADESKTELFEQSVGGSAVEDKIHEKTELAAHEKVPEKTFSQRRSNKKLAARHNRGLFKRREDKLERILVHQSSPFEQA